MRLTAQRVLAGLGLSIALVGCVKHGRPQLMTPIQKDTTVNDVLSIAVKLGDEWSCPTEQIQYAHLEGRLASFTGCGEKVEFIRWCERFRRTCYWTDLDRLRTRAAFDLSCEKSGLELSQLDEKLWGVRGCDRRSVYRAVATGKGGRLRVEWIDGSADIEKEGDPQL